MPGKVKVKVVAGRNLPVMDRSNDTTDAYVEVKLGSTTFKTDVCRKSLNPQWDSEWFRFEMDDLELQDEPLQIRLMDHDTYSANDAIGKVYLDLNPLLLTSSNSKGSKDQSGNLIAGWIPVYDTMHGIRGEVNLVVKVELFSDLNKFRQSSCGVKFFFTQAVPDGYFAHSIHGFVEELVVNDDPEYQWIDKIRTPRASNEARQLLISKLSGEVQRRVGLKALELGGNAVIGYRQCFDLEGESGIVVRGIGTAATLTKQFESQLSPSGLDSASGILRECQSVDDPHLMISSIPLSSHPSSMLSKTSRSKRTGGSRVPTSTHSMPETLYNDTNIDHLVPTSSTPKLPHRMPLKHENSLPVRLTNSASNFLSECLMLNVQASSSPQHRHLDNLIIPKSDVTVGKICSPLTKLQHASFPLSLISSTPNDSFANTSLSQMSDNNYDSLETDNEIVDKVKFETGAESLSSLSGVDTEIIKIDDSMDEGQDSAVERRKLLTNENNLSLIIVPRKPRGSKKKDKYSKSSLLKRASMNFADSKKVTDGKDKFTNEIVKFFKKKKTLLGDDTSSLGESSTYRQPKSSIFRRRQNFHGTLQRCNSENFSLGETSLDSLPSIQSELVFDPEDDTDSNSLESLPRNSQCSPIHPVEIPVSNESNVVGVSSDTGLVNELGLPGSSSDVLKRSCRFTANINSSSSSVVAHKSDDHDERWIGEGLYGNKLADATTTSLAIDAMKELGYGMEKPLNLYISSADALLVYEPSIEFKYATDNTNNITTENTKKLIKSHCLGSGEKGGNNLNNISSSRISTVDSTCSFTSTSTSMTNNSSSSGFGQYQSYDTFNSIQSPPLSVEVVRRGTQQQRSSTFASSHVGRGPLAGFYSQSSNKFGVHSYHNRSLSDSSHGMGWRSSSRSSAAIANHESTELPIVANESTALASSCFAPCDNNYNGNASVHGNRKVENGPYTSSHRSPIPEEISETSEKSCSPHNITASFVNAASNTTTTTNTFTNTSTATISNANTIASSTNLTPASRPLTSARNPQTTCYTSTSMGSNRSTNVSSTLSSGTPSNKLNAISPAKVATTVSFINRRSSESDLCTPPKPISTTATTMTTILATSSHGKTLTFAPMPHRRLITADHFEMLEYPFITLNQLPAGFIQHLGGTVSARSVKLLERISNLDEPESRDSWWTEIRMEIRSHARAIGCNVVLGYEEQTTICDDVCVLSASGTAAVVSSTGGGDPPEVAPSKSQSESGPGPRTDKERSHVRTDSVGSQHQNGYGKGLPPTLKHSESVDVASCSMCHIPYSESSVPFPVKMARCFLCKRAKVPDILLLTVDLPPSIQTFGKSCLIQAQVYRPKRDCKGEVSAKEVSDSLPFLEYELHRRLINKLKVRGMNAIFALQVQICLGEKLMVGLATGTAVFVACLPPSTYPKISAGNLKTDSQKVLQFQKVVQEVYEKNREIYQLKNVAPIHTGDNSSLAGGDAEDIGPEEDLPDIDLATGNKDTYVLEVDDAEDIDIIQVLIDPSPELGSYMLEPHVNNINFLHGFENCRVMSQQMFTQVWRCRISPLISLRQFTNYFDKLLQAVAFKLRRISPCVLSKLRYRVELPEQDEMQLSIIGLAVRLEEKPKQMTEEISQSGSIISTDDNNLVSNNDAAPKSPANLHPANGTTPSNVSPDTLYLTTASTGGPNVSPSGSLGTNQGSVKSGVPKLCPRAMQLLNRPRCIEITPLANIPGGKIEKYLGNLNFFFIRETTSIRESGGLSGFVHSFIAEVLAIVRAHVAALGGNAMVSYFMTELSLLHNPHKNQGQCLVNIGGDVVRYGIIQEDQS